MELIVDGDAKMADKDYGRKCKFRRLRRSGLTTLRLQIATALFQILYYEFLNFVLIQELLQVFNHAASFDAN